MSCQGWQNHDFQLGQTSNCSALKQKTYITCEVVLSTKIKGVRMYSVFVMVAESSRGLPKMEELDTPGAGLAEQ